jgi:hypothetical protein
MGSVLPEHIQVENLAPDRHQESELILSNITFIQSEASKFVENKRTQQVTDRALSYARAKSWIFLA